MKMSTSHLTKIQEYGVSTTKCANRVHDLSYFDRAKLNGIHSKD